VHACGLLVCAVVRS